MTAIAGAHRIPDALRRVDRRPRQAGPSHTLGAAGVVALDLAAGTSAVTTIPAPVVTAVDTAGYGDAFLGALAYRLALDDDPITASRYAVDVGAFAATRAGAQSYYPTSAELRTSVRAPPAGNHTRLCDRTAAGIASRLGH